MSTGNSPANDEIRSEVSKAYAEALGPSTPVASGGCCSSATPKAPTAKVAGYSEEQLQSIPEDAAVNSFGCGNPLAFAQVKPGETVVDLGSGAGIDLLLAAKQVGESGQVIGVDMTDAMIERARQNIREADVSNVEVRKGIIEALPVEDGSVDWVISNCVINLSPEKPRVFSEIARVLRPGGRFSISDIVVKELPQWIRENTALYNACVSGAISEEAYLAGLRDAGLEEVTVDDRIVYEASQIKAFILSGELPAGIEINEATADSLAKQLSGQVWSAKISGRKPA